ncbi:MAG: CdaR family protein [Candidatus Aminicenantaceae bacterium]
MKRLFKNLFLRNWGLKLFSLLLALILWMTLIPPEKIFSKKNLTIPLVIHNIPSGMELVRKPPNEIDVTIEAPNRYIDRITPVNVMAKLNLENATIIQEDYTINETMVSIPAGVRAEVIKISPNTVNLKLEKTKEILLDVEPDIIGIEKLKEGLKIEKIETIPSQVSIIGLESKVRDDYKVRTSPIDISALTETTEFEAYLILPSPDLRLASSLTKVKVTIYIQKETPEDKEGDIKKTQKK